MKTVRHIKNHFRRVMPLLLAVSMLLAGSFLPDTGFFSEAFASDGSNAIQKGDVLLLKTGDWEEEYIVLEPDKTSNKKPGTFLLKKELDSDVAFNFNRYTGEGEEDQLEEYLKVANKWEGSLSQYWCKSYFNGLPESVKNAVIGVKSNETESGTDWAGVNNIDGTRTGDEWDKDKVFFLSFIEYDMHKDLPNMQKDGKWHLRSPYACGDLAVYVCVVSESGRVLNFGYTDKLAARPAMNIDLTRFVSVAKCRHEGIAKYMLDETAPLEPYSDIEYDWTEDNSRCKATAVCNVCGETVTETVDCTSAVTKQPSAEEEGVRTYFAKFSEAAFDTQSRTVPISKTPAKASEKTNSEAKVKEVRDSKLPKAALKKPGQSKKTITVKWRRLSKKQQRKIRGIEIQCSANKKFTKIVSKKTVKRNKAGAKIGKLGRKKTYWVRVRTYKYVGKVKHVSAWSKVRKVRTK